MTRLSDGVMAVSTSSVTQGTSISGVRSCAATVRSPSRISRRRRSMIRSGGIGDDLPRIAFGKGDQSRLAEHFVDRRQPPQQLLPGLARLTLGPFRHAPLLSRRQTALL